uniref:Uncharacterized protein n=1 Tax=Hanusia phi TaxID=3032 RepID=A0A7S0E7Y5_9CRYP|mmetsp:Transcript_18605/g.42502  ORF Transcript_18605/g.42502 Transcript_18605/m.42502 type:complete len:869 (+) Transcript_18605:269-2875(+)
MLQQGTLLLFLCLISSRWCLATQVLPLHMKTSSKRYAAPVHCPEQLADNECSFTHDDETAPIKEIDFLSSVVDLADSSLKGRQGCKLEPSEVTEALKELSLLKEKTEKMETSLSDRLGKERALTRFCIKERDDDPDSMLLSPAKVAEIAVNEIYGDHVANKGSVHDKKGNSQNSDNQCPILVPRRNARTDILGNKLLMLLHTSKDLIQSCHELLNETSKLTAASQRSNTLEEADQVIQTLEETIDSSEDEFCLQRCDNLAMEKKSVDEQRLGIAALRGGQPASSDDSLNKLLDTRKIKTVRHPQPLPELPRIVLHKDKIREIVFGRDPWTDPSIKLPANPNDYIKEQAGNLNMTKEDIWLLHGGDIPLESSEDDEPTGQFKELNDQILEGFNESLRSFCEKHRLDLGLLSSARRRLEYIRNFTVYKQRDRDTPWHVKEAWRKNKTARYERERAIEVKYFRHDMFRRGYPEDGLMSKEEAARILDERDQNELYHYYLDELLPAALVAFGPEDALELEENLRNVFPDKPRFGGRDPKLIYPDDPDAWSKVLEEEELTGQTAHPRYPRNFFYPKGDWSTRIPNMNPLLPPINSRRMRKVREKVRVLALKAIEERQQREEGLKVMAERFDNITKDPEVLPDREEAHKLEVLLRWNITDLSELDELLITWIAFGANQTFTLDHPNEEYERLELTEPYDPYWKENVTRLLQDGADINHHHPAMFNFTAMHVACCRGNVSVIEYVRELGADLEAKSENGGTPLHHSSFDGRTAVVEKLLELGAQVNALNVFSQTPLHAACMCGNNETAAVLVEAGVDVNVRDSEGNLAVDIVESLMNNPPLVYEGSQWDSESMGRFLWLRDFLRSRQSSAPMQTE